MAFSKKTWKDRISQYINRRLLTDSDGNTQQVTVTRDEGSVTEAGDAFSAANMNDLEDRIDAAFDGLTAADIPYSAGVSVADKLDSLSDTSVETRPSLITLPTGSSLNANIQTYGRLVVINLVGFLAPAYTSIGELHFTNLPPLYGINELYAITPKGRFRIYNDGDVASIRLYDTNNATSYIGVPFVYLTV